MKILTANIAFGMPEMDRLGANIRAHLAIHGSKVFLHTFVPWLRGRLANADVADGDYIRRKTDLSPTIALIRKLSPDILVLNEVLHDTHKDEIERALRGQGFSTIAWGLGGHYPSMRISTVIATKAAGEIIPCDMPQQPSMGGGAGCAQIQLPDGIAIIGVHLGNGIPKLIKRQVHALATTTASALSHGHRAILAGDFNVSASYMQTFEEFKALSLVAADGDRLLTCPTFLPFRKPLDHIFVPTSMEVTSIESLTFGSDHLAVCAEVTSSIGE